MCNAHDIYSVLQFVVFFALAMSPMAMADAGADAHYGGYGGRRHGGYRRGHVAVASHPVCKTVFDVTHTQECSAVPEQVCNTVTETITKTEFDNVCNTVTEQACHPVTKHFPEEQCTTDYVQECVNTPRTVVDTAVVEECHDVKTQVCEETALVGVHRNVAVQPVAAHGHPFGIIKREAEPEADAEAEAEPHLIGGHGPAPRCRAVVRRACKQVPVHNPRVVPETRCAQRPVPKCATISRPVTDTVCNAVPREVCNQVARQVPVAVPRQVCKSVPRQVCRSVPHKVARKVCHQGAAHSYTHQTHG